MSWADDYLKKQQGITDAKVSGSSSPYPGDDLVEGFLTSGLSAIPEMFGDKPMPGVEQYRAEHPWLGLGSELVGWALPYGGVFKASETLAGSRMLGSAMEAIPGVKRLTALDNPILHAAAKEVIRYSPVELARLGVGLETTDTWEDYGNLFTDVALSTLITGGVGGIGGFFRVGGPKTKAVGGVEGAPFGLSPTFEYRLSKAPTAAPANKGIALGDVQNKLLTDIFTEVPDAIDGRVGYVNKLVGGNPETDALMNTLFKIAPGEKQGVRRQPLMDKAKNWALDDDNLTRVLGALGERSGGQIKTMEDFAELAVTPRLVTVNSSRAAGTVSKALDDSAMQWVGDGVMAGKEAEGGLHVMAVRLRAGDEALGAATAAEKAGAPKIAPGDQWMLFKTDQPHVFAPKGYKLAKAVVNAWSMFKPAWRESGQDDFANAAMDVVLKNFTPQDWKERVTMPEATARARISERLAQRFAETTDLKNSDTINHLVDQFFDIMAPTVVNERRNPLFARLFGTLKAGTKAGDVLVNRAIGGRIKVKGGIWTRKNIEHSEGILPGRDTISGAIAKLNADELADFKRIGDAQAPMEELEQYVANGLVSDNLRNAVQLVQDVDRHFWENHLMPAFKNANLDGKFDLLNGYIMPRLWTGDYFAPVVDEYGKMVWLGNGTRRQAVAHAQAIIDEAAKTGRQFTMKEPYLKGLDKHMNDIEDLHDLVQMQIGKSEDVQQIVLRAMKKIAIEQSGNKKALGNLPKINAPGPLTKARTGIQGSADLATPDAATIIKSIDSHYKQLFRFAATMSWRNRFLSQAKFLETENRTVFKDLNRKMHQILGFEGQFTKALNNALSPVLGQHLGGKAATTIAAGTNELLYAWNLAIVNPTFALLNVLQPVQTVLPHIAFIMSTVQRNMPRAFEDDMHMVLRHGADGKPREVMGVLSPAKVLGKAIRLMGNPDEELKGFLGQGKTDGTLMAQLFEGWIGGQSQGLETIGDAFRNAGGGVAGSWQAMRRIATFGAERSEDMSRAIAFNAYYILGKEYLGMSGDRLYQFMRQGTHNSMFGYSLLDRSRMFTGPVGSMFGLFKNWQMHFIASMFQYAKLGWKHDAWGPLIWQFGAAGALGGLGAMGPLKWTADAIARWNSDSPNSYLWMQNNWHDAADELYFGLPALFGASLQASSTMPGTDVRNDITTLSNFVFLERAKAAAKATGAAWDYAEVNGRNPLKDPNIRDALMQAYAPRALFRAFAGTEGDYIKSMTTGYPQVRGVSPLSQVLYASGLNQVEVEKQQVAAREIWKDEEARKTQIQQLGRRLADAQLNRDFDEMQRVNMQGMAMGLPMSSVYKSARTRLMREEQGDILSRYGKSEMAQQYRQAWAQDADAGE